FSLDFHAVDFFFQAEDGIRDRNVTGVQTCALPISYYRAEVYLNEGGQDYDVMGWTEDEVIGDILDQYERHRLFLHIAYDTEAPRSEERRVGKEGRDMDTQCAIAGRASSKMMV